MYSVVGTGCDLEAGHDGDHVRTYTDGRTVTWNADGDRRFVDHESRRTLGT